jgi:hypothetical protein
MIAFPEDVSTCAMSGMVNNSGFPDIVYRSSVPTDSGPKTVTIVIDTPDPVSTRTNVDLNAVC